MRRRLNRRRTNVQGQSGSLYTLRYSLYNLKSTTPTQRQDKYNASEPPCPMRHLCHASQQGHGPSGVKGACLASRHVIKAAREKATVMSIKGSTFERGANTPRPPTRDGDAHVSRELANSGDHSLA